MCDVASLSLQTLTILFRSLAISWTMSGCKSSFFIQNSRFKELNLVAFGVWFARAPFIVFNTSKHITNLLIFQTAHISSYLPTWPISCHHHLHILHSLYLYLILFFQSLFFCLFFLSSLDTFDLVFVDIVHLVVNTVGKLELLCNVVSKS